MPPSVEKVVGLVPEGPPRADETSGLVSSEASSLVEDFPSVGVDSPTKSVGEEFVDMLQCNNLLGPNHSSPLTALVSDPSGDFLNSGELEFLGFGEEDSHSWEGGPLAQWDPNEALVLVAEGCVTDDVLRRRI